jgi:predicted glycosyltransferase
MNASNGTPQVKRVLYGVSSVGLGHIRRSILIAKRIRALMGSSIEIDWICAEPGLSHLRSVGENVLPVSEKLESMSDFIERGTVNGRIQDIGKVARLTARAAKHNYSMIRPLLSSYDALIQDEFVETIYSSLWDKKPPLPQRRIFITDYVRLETDSHNPINRLTLWRANNILKSAFSNQNLLIFADDEDALPEDSKVRDWVSKSFRIVGPIVDDMQAQSKSELKKQILNRKNEDRIIVFGIGGTSIGKDLLSFVATNANSISESLHAHLVILLGPRLYASQFPKSYSVTYVPFMPDIPKYFKMADCVVTQAGASSLNEIASLGIPCVCVPIENHWEQRHNAARFSTKFGFEVLEYGNLSKESISRAIERAISRSYSPLNSQAADQAANLIVSVIP